MITLLGNPTELKDDSILSDKMVMWFPHLHQFLKQRICLRWVWKQYVYICARMEVCETDPKTTWSNFAPCDLVTSEDFSLLHKDDVDGESGDECEMKAVDTLSELGSQSSSSKRLVTPQCKRDKLLQNRSLQVEAWDNVQTPSPPSKPRADHIMALAEALKNARHGASYEKPVETKGQLPDHVPRP